MLGPTYGAIRNETPNQGFEILYAAFGSPSLLALHQDQTVAALRRAKPEAADDALIALLDKRAERRRRTKAAVIRRAEEGAWVAWAMRAASAAGEASGETAALLDTEDGRALLERGLGLACDHGARELLR